MIELWDNIERCQVNKLFEIHKSSLVEDGLLDLHHRVEEIEKTLRMAEELGDDGSEETAAAPVTLTRSLMPVLGIADVGRIHRTLFCVAGWLEAEKWFDAADALRAEVEK